MELLNVPKLPSINPLFVSLILLFTLLIWHKLAKRKHLNLPPSPPKLPIIGNIHQLGKLPHRSLRDLSRNYGSLLLLHLGCNPTLLVSSADMVREILKDHDAVFSDRPSSTATNILFYGCRDIAFAPYGEYWRQQKKLSVVELLSHRRVHSFQFVRDEEVELLINKIRRACLKGDSINLSEMLMLLAKSTVVLLTSFCVGDLFPYLRWVDVLTGYIPRLKALFGELDSFFDQIIKEHTTLKTDDQVSNKDFISIIMQLQKDGMLEIDLTNIKAILLDTFVAGTDTTGATTEWMMAELLQRPNVMKKVQEEYLKCVLKETLRLHPTVPLLVPRQTSVSVELGGYHIPSNITILINAWAIQRDPKWWENPEEFIPERFENSSIDFKGQDVQFIPFGFGRRSCPGIPFAVSVIEYVMANLLYWFDWKLPVGEIAENLDMTELYGQTINRKNPLHVVPMSHFTF
ncbi:hypothetical protein GOBAR_DD32297 [Gossypium barbadense]|nr:hypothetical protein GOBAR_DD32297 [Gossypium barbadense]